MRTLRLSLLMASFAVLLLWLVGRANRENTGSATGLLAGQDYDYFISAMSTTGFTATGEALYHLAAERVTHFPEGDVAVLETPAYTRIAHEGSPWQVTALQGRLEADAGRNEERLELQDEVLFVQQPAGSAPLQIRADRLTVFPASEEAATDAEVILDASGTRLESRGIKLHMAQDKIELPGNVRGSHEQQAK